MAEVKQPSKQQLANAVREKIFDQIVPSLTEYAGEVVRVSATEIAIPQLTANGDECWGVIKVSIPTGARDGTEYDPYPLAESYKVELANKQAAKDGRAMEEQASKEKAMLRKLEREIKQKGKDEAKAVQE